VSGSEILTMFGLEGLPLLLYLL